MATSAQELGHGQPPAAEDDDIQEYQEPTRPMAVVPAREASEIERRQMSGGLLRLVAPVAEVLAAQNEMRAMLTDVLKDCRDYGTVPGVKKKFLFKAGAERVNGAYGLAARFRVLEQEIDHDRPNEYEKEKRVYRNEFQGDKRYDVQREAGTSRGCYRYVVLCELVDRRTGIVVGEGVGSASTMESKYIDRPRDLENTALKMGKKRAYVDATLTVHGLSDEFTQDEDVVKPQGASHGGGDADDGVEALNPDALIGFGRHAALTWRQACQDEPEWVFWASGRKDGEGAQKKLGRERQKELGKLLDEVQGKTSRPATSDEGKGPQTGYVDPGAPPELEPLNRKVGTGPHAERTWLEVIDQHPDYARKAVASGWCKLKKSENADLLAAISEELALRRMGTTRSEFERDVAAGSDEARQSGGVVDQAGPHETRFLAMMNEARVPVEEWQVLALAHAQLPDTPMDWTDDHYRIAIETTELYGVQNMLERAKARVANARSRPGSALQSQPRNTAASDVVSNIKAEEKRQGESLLATAATAKVDPDTVANFKAALDQAIHDDNAEMHRSARDELQALVFKTLGKGAEPKQGDLLR